MAYTPREIKDRVAVGDDVFIVEDLGDNRIRLIPAPTHVSEPGTPVNKALLQPIEDELGNLSTTKVDKVSGKGLSTNDFTNALKNKLDGIQAGAQVNAVTSVAGKTGAVTLSKSDVGLGSVQNYGIATQAQAQAGTSNSVYMTPLRVTNALNSIKDSLFPSGGIIMWSGSISNIPSGWALCDGSNGTPDLRDRFIVGAGRDYSVGSTGGADTVKLTINQMPSHDHGSGSLSASTAGSHSHSYRGPAYPGSVGSGSDHTPYQGAATEDTGSAGSHSHIITGTTSSRGGGQAHENRPPYYALCFIMKL